MIDSTLQRPKTDKNLKKKKNVSKMIYFMPYRYDGRQRRPKQRFKKQKFAVKVSLLRA